MQFEKREAINSGKDTKKSNSNVNTFMLQCKQKKLKNQLLKLFNILNITESSESDQKQSKYINDYFSQYRS